MGKDEESLAKEAMDDSEGARLEKLISELGPFGRYQFYVISLSCIGCFMPAMVVVAMTFLAYEPDHRCQIEACEPSLLNTSYSRTFLNFTTPYEASEERWSRCLRYEFQDIDSADRCQASNFGTLTEPCGPGHVFDDRLFKSSIITDFDLWCVSPFYRSLAGMSYMLGMLLG
ncbi:solute carrier family 22 member 6-B-like, partial [Hyalella azteca]|uniref:Solute carrier family 22 member 6-B-like n=1 Tax=Hyalella azteca TaxID=294128 RepID=A0A979FX34_HYAAZ